MIARASSPSDAGATRSVFEIPATAVFHQGENAAVWTHSPERLTLDFARSTCSVTVSVPHISIAASARRRTVAAGVHTVYAGERVMPVKPLLPPTISEARRRRLLRRICASASTRPMSPEPRAMRCPWGRSRPVSRSLQFVGLARFDTSAGHFHSRAADALWDRILWPPGAVRGSAVYLQGDGGPHALAGRHRPPGSRRGDRSHRPQAPRNPDVDFFAALLPARRVAAFLHHQGHRAAGGRSGHLVSGSKESGRHRLHLAGWYSGSLLQR